MISNILSTMLPIVVTLMLGFVAAWHQDFVAKEATVLNRMVLMYAVPLSVFVGTVSTSRANLIQSVPLALVILLGIVGMYGLVYWFCRRVFRFTIATSALAALAASGPAVPFLGPAILGGVFNGDSAVPIAVGSIVINITIVPLTIFLLTLDRASVRTPLGASIGAAAVVPVPGTTGVDAAPESGSAFLIEHLKETIRKPLVWAPVLGFVMVLLDVHLPSVVNNSFLLLGHASAGVALFASGIVLAAYKIKLDWYTVLFVLLKNIVQPALVFGALLWLGLSGPVLAQTVMTLAIPAMPILVMLALEYGVAEDSAPSILLLSTVASVFTVGGFMWLTA